MIVVTHYKNDLTKLLHVGLSLLLKSTVSIAEDREVNVVTI